MSELYLKKIYRVLLFLSAISLAGLVFNTVTTVYTFTDWTSDLSDLVADGGLDDDWQDLLDQGAYDAVVQSCSEREKDYPKDLNIFYYRGLSYFYQKQYAEALSDFQQLIEIDPTWEISVSSYMDVIESKTTE